MLKAGDTVKFSPGYIEGKSDKVFITQKEQFEQHPEILYNTSSALEVEHDISTSNTDGQRGSSEPGTVGEVEEESELPISYRSEEYQRIPQPERDRLVISVSGEVPESKSDEIILSTGDTRLIDIAGVFGKRLVMYTLPKGYTDSGGFWHRAEPGSIYLNTSSKTPHLVVLGHELVHALKKQFPQLYKELQRLNVMKPVFEHTKAESERTYKRKLKDGDVKEEVYSNYVGAKFTDAQFWDNLSKQAPHIFEKMVAMVKAMIKKVLDALGGRYKTDHYFDDIKKADRIVTNVMARYAELAKNGAKERVNADILRYSAKKNTSDSLKTAIDGDFTPEQWDSIAKATGVLISEAKELLGYSEPVNVDEVPIIDLTDQISNIPFRTSTKNAVTEEERATRGLDPVEQHMKYTDPVMFAEGMRPFASPLSSKN
jgi:hypothetical protein